MPKTKTPKLPAAPDQFLPSSDITAEEITELERLSLSLVSFKDVVACAQSSGPGELDGGCVAAALDPITYRLSCLVEDIARRAKGGAA